MLQVQCKLWRAHGAVPTTRSGAQDHTAIVSEFQVGAMATSVV